MTGRGMPRPVRLRLSWRGMVREPEWSSSGCRSSVRTRASPGSTRGSRPACRSAAGRGLPSPCRRPSTRPDTSGAVRMNIHRRRQRSSHHRRNNRRWNSHRHRRPARVAARGATAVVAAGRALSLTLRPAIGAALWLGVAALLVERLLPGRKCECLAAIAAGDRPIGQLAETLSRRGRPRHVTNNEPQERFRRNRTSGFAVARIQTNTYTSISSGLRNYTTNHGAVQSTQGESPSAQALRRGGRPLRGLRGRGSEERARRNPSSFVRLLVPVSEASPLLPPEAQPTPLHSVAPSTRQALMPPKPKEFLSR